MSQVPVCTIFVSSESPAEELESLNLALQMNGIELQKSTHRVFGADDVAFVATIMGGLAATAQLIEYGVKLAKVINNWRKDCKAKGQKIQARLEHPNKPPLDLDTATDEEVEEWLSH